MALVSIDPKALEHACLCAGRSVHHFDRMGDDLPLRASIVAHARAIERLEATEARHAAELRELKERFSEVAARMVAMAEEDCSSLWAGVTRQILAPFILPAPDPLVEVMNEMGFGMSKTAAEEFRTAMQARGYEWRKIGEAGE